MSRIREHIKPSVASIPTIRRLPAYLQVVRRFHEEGKPVISGPTIAEELNLEAIQVRKDLAVTGISGKPRVGYPVLELITAIEKFLGWDRRCRAVVIGAGNLGSALMNYKELQHHGLTLVAAFDNSPERVGSRENGLTVYPMEQIKERIKKEKAELAILTVPADKAQETCNILVEAGIKQIWNFANVRLRVPENVQVLREDLSSGYAVLTVLQGLRKA